MSNDLILYTSPDGKVSLELKVEGDSFWLTQREMATLFDKDTDSIGLHLNNIFKEGELDPAATTEESSVVQKEGNRQVRRKVMKYNLDAVISVGYRVSSQRGTWFRIWATKVLRDHIVQGYTVHQTRLSVLNRTIQIISSLAQDKPLDGGEARGLFRVLSDFSYALQMLDDYDHQRLAQGRLSTGSVLPLGLEEARKMIVEMKRITGASELFGREKDKSLAATLGAVFQAFGGREVYPSLEEKAANLLYLLIKNHSFVDGNKRIGAALFLAFLERNGGLYRADGRKVLDDGALVGITLMIAESRPEEKAMMTTVVMNLLGKNQGEPT